MGVGYATPRLGGPRYGGIAPVRFFRPYYVFRPRLSLGFGLWAGFPFAYYDPYYDPYYNPYYSPYGYRYSYPYSAYGYRYPAPSYPAYPPPAYPPPGYQEQDDPPPANSVDVQPRLDQANTGGVSFEITPGTAEVFVDGSLVGTVGDFVPTTQPLGLTPGRHHIEIRAPGYQTMSLDVDIVAGQVIPYQGVMQR